MGTVSLRFHGLRPYPRTGCRREMYTPTCNGLKAIMRRGKANYSSASFKVSSMSAFEIRYPLD
jgi:hypothetical protein